MIKPHGGILMNRMISPSERTNRLEHARSLKKFQVSSTIACDLELIATGAYSPFSGFMNRQEYLSVIRNMHLASGLPWTIPITFPVTEEEARNLKPNQDVALLDEDNRYLAVLRIEEIYPAETELEADHVYKTRENAHPGVRRLNEQGKMLVAGPIFYLAEKKLDDLFADYNYAPADTRERFFELGWRTIVAFQTRNPIHRSHEYIQKCALEIVDGLFLHPLVGATKQDDIPAEVRIKCYEALLQHYYPSSRTFLSIFPAAMRYAGPREAVHHAIVRKNYGATHFIVGRDHAGVGNYYGPYDAQTIFSEFDREKIGITPLFFGATFYCKICEQIASEKTCSHPPESRLSLSGSKIRELLRKGETLPREFARPQVSRILRDAYFRQQPYSEEET